MVYSENHSNLDVNELTKKQYSLEFIRFVQKGYPLIKEYMEDKSFAAEEILFNEMCRYLSLSKEEKEYINENTDWHLSDYRRDSVKTKKFILRYWRSRIKTIEYFYEYFTEVFKCIIERVRDEKSVTVAVGLTQERLEKIERTRIEDEAKGLPINGKRIDFILKYLKEEVGYLRKAKKEQGKQLLWLVDDAQLTCLYDKLKEHKMIECTESVFFGVFGKKEYSVPVKWLGKRRHLMWLILSLEEMPENPLVHIPPLYYHRIVNCFVSETGEMYDKDGLREAKSVVRTNELDKKVSFANIDEGNYKIISEIVSAVVALGADK